MRNRAPSCSHLGWVLAAAVCLAAARPARAEVSALDVQRRVDALVARVKGRQQEDGSFLARQKRWPVGHTALAVLALRTAGVRADDPAVRTGAAFLVRRGTVSSYGVYQNSLRIMALESVDPDAYRDEIAASARYLMRAQQPSGGWTYGDSGRTDNSNSQFAVLGLNSAALSGIDVPEALWRSARDYFALGQNRDGGWGYRTADGDSYGSMTAAGLASLYVCDLWLHARGGRCGVYYSDVRVQNGLGWLAAHFSVTGNPGTDAVRWKFYYLYGLERAGVILARRYFGRHDWYREGIEHLVGRSPDPAAMGPGNEWDLLRDCFELLFLAKANAPILMLKAQWGGRWHSNRYDARFLVQYVARLLRQPLDWQIAPLSSPLKELMAAPVLYMSGKGSAVWSSEEVRRLKEHSAAGGFLLVEAADGDPAFDRAFRTLVRERFPEEQLVGLPKDHPIYTAYFDIPADERPDLEAVMGPCWLSVLYAPQGLSCEWDVADFDHVNFKLGANIVAYVTGLTKLEGKLAEPVYYVPAERPPEERRGAFALGQVVHDGNWQPHKVAWTRVLEDVNQKAGLTVYSRPLPIRPDVESPFQAQMLYLTGVEELRLNAETQRALKLYLERGGFVFAEAACGSKRFDASFRRLIKQMYPDQELKELPLGHPLFEGGEPLGQVEYSPAVREETPELRRPLLEFIELNGRAAVIYSRYDISSAIDGHPCYRCPSVLQPSAGRLAVQVVLYGLAS